MGEATEKKAAVRSSHVARPRFYRRTEAYTALMPIVLAGRVVKRRGNAEPKHKKLPVRNLKVGDTIKADEFRLHVLKYLFLRGRIGPAGHPWTARALERIKARNAQAMKAKDSRKKHEDEVKQRAMQKKKAKDARKKRGDEVKQRAMQKKKSDPDHEPDPDPDPDHEPES